MLPEFVHGDWLVMTGNTSAFVHESRPAKVPRLVNEPPA